MSSFTIRRLEPSSDHKRILCVEPELDICEILAQLLIDIGLEPQFARTCEEAISTLQNQTFDLVLLDIHMPDAESAGLFRLVEEKVRAHAISLVAVTSGEAWGRERFPFIVDILAKPFGLDQLRSAIMGALQRALS